MPRSKPTIIVACGLAIILIVAAVIIRYTNSNHKASSSLAYVNNANSASQDTSLEDRASAALLASSTDLSVPAINQTDALSRKLFSSFMVLQNSNNLNGQTISDLVTNIASNIDASVTPKYQLSDLTLISNATPKDLKDYANKFWAIRQKYVDLYKQNQLGSSTFLADPTDPSFAHGFVNTGNLYIQMAKDLSKLSVPAELANLHLKLLNNYIASGLSLKKLDQINTDPIATISGLSTFSQYSDYEDTILSILAQYFSKNGIIFNNTSDPGYGWNSI